MSWGNGFKQMWMLMLLPRLGSSMEVIIYHYATYYLNLVKLLWPALYLSTLYSFGFEECIFHISVTVVYYDDRYLFVFVFGGATARMIQVTKLHCRNCTLSKLHAVCRLCKWRKLQGIGWTTRRWWFSGGRSFPEGINYSISDIKTMIFAKLFKDNQNFLFAFCHLQPEFIDIIKSAEVKKNWYYQVLWMKF